MTCPVCNRFFSACYPNLALLELIPLSEYDKSFAELEKLYNETLSVKNDIKHKKETKLAHLNTKIDELKSQINQTTQEIINVAMARQKELLSEADAYKIRVSSLYQHSSSLDDSTRKYIDLVKNNLKAFAYNQEQIRKTSQEMSELKEKLNKKLNELTNSQEFVEFIANFRDYSINVGSISERVKTFKEYQFIGNEFYRKNQYQKALNFF